MQLHSSNHILAKNVLAQVSKTFIYTQTLRIGNNNFFFFFRLLSRKGGRGILKFYYSNEECLPLISVVVCRRGRCSVRAVYLRSYIYRLIYTASYNYLTKWFSLPN